MITLTHEKAGALKYTEYHHFPTHLVCAIKYTTVSWFQYP